MSKQSLSKIALKAMALRLAVVVVLVAVVGFWHYYNVIEKKTVQELEQYVKERVERESIHFNSVERKLQLFVKILEKELEKPRTDYNQEFNRRFKLQVNGTYSSASGSPVQMFLKKGVPVTPDMKKRMVILDELLLKFGEAWSSNLTNVWAAGIEDYGMTFWPSRPKALTDLPVDHSFLTHEFMAIGLPADNPKGEPRWTGPYLDIMSKDWMISMNHPVLINGEFVMSIGMDVLLNDFYQRSISNILDSTYNIVFRDDGRLISHPSYLEAVKTAGGNFFIQNQSDSVLKNIFHKVSMSGSSVIDDSENDLFMGVGKIKGPEWSFILVYPKENLKSLAQEIAIFLAVVGLISLIIELLILFHVIETTISSPIKKLIHATEKVSEGSMGERVEVKSEDELGQLARSFNLMSDKVLERDKQLSDQAAKLEVQVQERSLELDVQRAKAFQAAKMATLGEISAGIAHEINNPLSTITLSAGGIRRRLEKDDINKESLFLYLSKIEDTSTRISKIVKGMRAFSRHGENDEMSAVPVRTIVENTLTLCEETLKKNEVMLECHNIPDVSVLCREVEIIQTLLNLIQNAADALVGRENRRIIISFREDDLYRSIIVEDNGPGVPREIEDKIMNPFFTTKDVGKGTGLGLFISCGLVKSNNGQLTLEQYSQKTQFIVSLMKA